MPIPSVHGIKPAHLSQAGAMGATPAERWVAAHSKFSGHKGLDEQLAKLGERVDTVRRVEPQWADEVIAAHVSARELGREFQSAMDGWFSKVWVGTKLPTDAQLDEITRNAEAFETANARLSNAIERLGYALDRATNDRQNPEYTKEGQERWNPNNAIFKLRSYLRTGATGAGSDGTAAPRPPLGTGAVIAQLQLQQEKLQETDSRFVSLATEHLPRLSVLAAGTSGARPDHVKTLDEQFRRAAQLRLQMPRLEEFTAPLPESDVAALDARINDYLATVKSSWVSEASVRNDVLDQANRASKAYTFGGDRATLALSRLAHWAALQVPRQSDSAGTVKLDFFMRRSAVNEALRLRPPEHGSALAQQAQVVEIAGTARTRDPQLKARCDDKVRVGALYSDPVCNQIHADLSALEAGVVSRDLPFMQGVAGGDHTSEPVPSEPRASRPPDPELPKPPALVAPVDTGNGKPSKPAPVPEKPKPPQDGAGSVLKIGPYTARMFEGGTPDELRMKKMLTGPDQMWSLGMRRAAEHLGLKPPVPVQVDFKVRAIDGELGIEARAELNNGKYLIEFDSADLPRLRDIKVLEQTVAHEGFHIAEFATLGYGLAADAWFGEGCAEFVGGGDAALAAHRDHFGSAQRVISNFPDRDENFYPASYAAVQYLHHQIRQAGNVNGVRYIFDLLQANPGATFDDALGHVARKLGGPVKGYVTEKAFIEDFKRNGAEFINKMNLTNDDPGVIGGPDAAAL